MSSIVEDITEAALSRWKLIRIQLLSAGVSSIVEVSLLTPLDVVKTRLQLQKNNVGNIKYQYNGVLDAFYKIYRREGIPAFWRGIVPPMLSDTPRRSFKLVMFEQLKPVFTFGDKPTVATYILAGSLAGMMEALLQSPFDVIKITQQANRKKKLSTLGVTKRIYREGGFGLKGLYRGVATTIIRNGIFHFAYLGLFSVAKDATGHQKTATREIINKTGLAFIFSWLGCFLSLPFDVIKSRIQGPQPVAGEVKYSRTIPTMVAIYKEEGITALYKGLIPQLLRQGPAGIILLLGFEFLNTIQLAKYV
ncbi:hypothetical protein KR093_010018 [Drosophila rubida]|uniref:Mitochondrial 2-oxodicarboxylate carrier n=1 Tax=Drosophila rubida TaxID=30044 RepID=A0AAD4K8T8_9MUSC|nr:hypothetical protein KR093_010018 [Drosophila rubida]